MMKGRWLLQLTNMCLVGFPEHKRSAAGLIAFVSLGSGSNVVQDVRYYC